MKRLLIAAIAALLVSGAAHASPTMPREFQGSWCAVTEEDAGPSVRSNSCPRVFDAFTVSGTEVQFHEESCAVAYVKPAKNGRYHVTLACTITVDNPITITHYWMRLYQGALYMQRVDSSFTQPQRASQ
jgi:hypothetical protein